MHSNGEEAAQIVQILIKNKANLNATNDVGDSALNMAASNSMNDFQNMESNNNFLRLIGYEQ